MSCAWSPSEAMRAGPRSPISVAIRVKRSSRPSPSSRLWTEMTSAKRPPDSTIRSWMALPRLSIASATSVPELMIFSWIETPRASMALATSRPEARIFWWIETPRDSIASPTCWVASTTES